MGTTLHWATELQMLPGTTVGWLPGVGIALMQFTQLGASGIWAVAVAATLPLDKPINLKKAYGTVRLAVTVMVE
jgi:hypothetical protein